MNTRREWSCFEIKITGATRPIPYVLQPAVKCTRCLLHRMIPLPPFHLSSLRSWNPLYPLDICTAPRCPAFSWIVEQLSFFFFSLSKYICIYIWKAGVLRCWYSFKVSLHLLRCGYAIGAKTRETERETEIKTSWNIVEGGLCNDAKKKKKGEGGGRLGLKRRYTEMEKLNRFRFFLPPSPPFF